MRSSNWIEQTGERSDGNVLDIDLTGKKLLLIGGINTTADLVLLAHRNGVKLGIVDYNKDTLLKSMADFTHDISRDISCFREVSSGHTIKHSHYAAAKRICRKSQCRWVTGNTKD